MVPPMRTVTVVRMGTLTVSPSSSSEESICALEADSMRTDSVRFDPVSAVSSPSSEDD